MNDVAVYISLKEAEDLIFNRMLGLPKSRLAKNRAQGLLSISISIDQKNLFEHKSEFLIFFSAVSKFEVPEKEKTLFLAHYKIPEGLLRVTKKRQLVRDENRKEQLFVDEFQYDTKKYTLLRNGCVGLYNLTCEIAEDKKLSHTVKRVFNSIFDGSNFIKTLLSELLFLGKFPIKEVKTEKIVSERFYRAVWLLTTVKQSFVAQIDESNVEELESARMWMRDLLEINDLIVIRKCIDNSPDILNQELNCILGYYFAATRFEEFQADKNALIYFIKDLNVKQENEILAWTSFFFSIFDDEIPYLYFSPLIQNDIIEIERLSFNCSFSEEKFNEKIQLQLNRDYSVKEKAENYLSLINGAQNQNIEVINETQVESVLKSNLSNDNLVNIGLELYKSSFLNSLGLNTCSIQNHYFQLNINDAANPKEVVFYLDKASKCDDKLKAIGIKRKSIDRLLSNKKVILGFTYIEELNKLTELYSAIISQIETIEKVVIICLFNLQPNQIQSIEFDNMFREYQSQISAKFSVDCEFIIRNEKNQDTQEIKRNLKNALGTYKISEIELVDENVSSEKMGWVIESSLGYWIEKKGLNYFSFTT